MVNEIKYVKGFNWKQFFRIVASISFIGAGLAVITVYKDKSILGMTLGFILIGIGFAIMVVGWDG